MTKEKTNKIHLIYGCILAALLLALGFAAILSCLDIYHSGPRPYSPTSIGSHFRQIAVLVYTAIAGIIGGIALELILPRENKRCKAIIDENALLHRQQKKTRALSDDALKKAQREQKYRKIRKAETAILFLLLMVFPFFYFLDLDHFTVASLNADIIKALAISLIPAVVGSIMCFICKQSCKNSILRETQIWKDGYSQGSFSSDTPTLPQHGNKKMIIVRSTMLAIATIFIIVGIFNGGASDVLLKAIAICTECIGLG